LKISVVTSKQANMTFPAVTALIWSTIKPFDMRLKT